MSDEKHGTVTSYNPTKGFGFIAVVNDSDYFFHVRDVERKIVPAIGQRVRFMPAPPSRGKSHEAKEITFERESDHDSNANN